LLNKYIKCNVWRLAVWYDIYIYIYMSLGGKELSKQYISLKEFWDVMLHSLVYIYCFLLKGKLPKRWGQQVL